MTEENKQLPNEQGEYKVGDKHPPKEFQWKPGQSGNRAGRPKFSLVSILREQLQEVSEGEKEGKAKELVKKAIELAVGGDTQMLKDIINRIDGMPKQSVSLGVDESVEEVSITIKRHEVKHTRDNGSGKDLGGTPEGNEVGDKSGGDRE